MRAAFLLQPPQMLNHKKDNNQDNTMDRDSEHPIGRDVVVGIGVEAAATAEVSIFVSFGKFECIQLVFKSRSSSPDM